MKYNLRGCGYLQITVSNNHKGLETVDRLEVVKRSHVGIWVENLTV